MGVVLLKMIILWLLMLVDWLLKCIYVYQEEIRLKLFEIRSGEYILVSAWQLEVRFDYKIFLKFC